MQVHDHSLSTETTTDFIVEGMNCASCVNHVQKAAKRVAGVAMVNVNLALGRASVAFDPGKTNPVEVAAAITGSGYPATPIVEQTAPRNIGGHHDRANAWLRRAVVGVILWLPLELTHWLMVVFSNHGRMEMPAMVWASFVAGTLSIIYVGAGFYRGAWAALKHFTSNMDTLIALGASVAYGYSLIAFFGHLAGMWPAPPAYYFMESSGLLALISLGHWLEARAHHSAGSAIAQLLNLAPERTLKLTGNDDLPVEIPLSTVQVGDRLLVRPGDRIPTDGVVVDGRGAVDESMITGEPIPPTRTIGDSVIGGTLNLDGRLVVRAANVGAQTALAQMVKLVENAQSAKPPVQKLADNIAAVFVPVVLMIAVITGAAWFIYGNSHGWTPGRTWADLANAVCSVLIIACPCALGLALPAALMVGTGLGASRGILIRDLESLQRAATVGAVVLDKTGTLTEGKPAVTKIELMDHTTENDLLALAAAAEQSSAHPLAKAVVAAAQLRNLKLPAVENFSSEAGYGVLATIGGRNVLVGSQALLRRHGWAGADAGGAAVYVASNDNGTPVLLATIGFTDTVKPDSAAAIAALHEMGLKTILLTGDSEVAAQAVGRAVGIDEVYARVTPDQKAAVIRKLQEKCPVAMVGDGINDAPALAVADLGIAIGSGSDIAKEAGGIVLVSGSLGGVPAAIKLARATMKTIRRNLVFAFLYNVLAIPLAAFGLLNPLIAAGAMALSDVTVIGSALMLRRCRLEERKSK